MDPLKSIPEQFEDELKAAHQYIDGIVQQERGVLVGCIQKMTPFREQVRQDLSGLIFPTKALCYRDLQERKQQYLSDLTGRLQVSKARGLGEVESSWLAYSRRVEHYVGVLLESVRRNCSPDKEAEFENYRLRVVEWTCGVLIDHRNQMLSGLDVVFAEIFQDIQTGMEQEYALLAGEIECFYRSTEHQWVVPMEYPSEAAPVLFSFLPSDAELLCDMEEVSEAVAGAEADAEAGSCIMELESASLPIDFPLPPPPLATAPFLLPVSEPVFAPAPAGPMPPCTAMASPPPPVSVPSPAPAPVSASVPHAGLPFDTHQASWPGTTVLDSFSLDKAAASGALPLEAVVALPVAASMPSAPQAAASASASASSTGSQLDARSVPRHEATLLHSFPLDQEAAASGALPLEAVVAPPSSPVAAVTSPPPRRSSSVLLGHKACDVPVPLPRPITAGGGAFLVVGSNAKRPEPIRPKVIASPNGRGSSQAAAPTPGHVHTHRAGKSPAFFKSEGFQSDTGAAPKGKRRRRAPAGAVA